MFEEQRPNLEANAKLLCDDPATANELLTAAMARATSKWRGPNDPEIRTFVLCWFVHHLMAHSRLAGMEQPATTPANIPLSELKTIQRVVVVLNDFAHVPIEAIADMVDLSPAEAQAELSRGKKVLTDAARRGGV